MVVSLFGWLLISGKLHKQVQRRDHALIAHQAPP
jgi:hypothetical protein